MICPSLDPGLGWRLFHLKGKNSYIIFIISDSVIPYVGLLASAGRDVTLLRPWSCGKNICPPGFTGQVCETEIGL